MKVETNIWYDNSYHNIKLDNYIKSFRQVTSFCGYNSLPDVLVKAQGGYYIITREGTLQFFTRTLNTITFQDLYNRLIKLK